MSDCIGERLIYNGVQRNCSDFESTIFTSEVSLYEVVRVIDKKPVFLDDHISRLENSVIASEKYMLMNSKRITEGVNDLIVIGSVDNGNLKISFNYEDGNEYGLIYSIRAKYPDNDLYRSGVHTVYFRATRENPKIKRYDYALRSEIAEKTSEAGAYEAMLVDTDNTLTEGSKSNVFFIRGNTVITSPENAVLAGITRKYVIELIKKRGLLLEERNISVNEVQSVDSVFISGTSPKILPVRSLEDHTFDVSNTHLRHLMSDYDTLLKKHLLDQ